MNPPYEQGRPNPPRTIIIEARQHHFTCDACQLPGVSESPNAKYHQTRDCQEVKTRNSTARAMKARARKRIGK